MPMLAPLSDLITGIHHVAFAEPAGAIGLRAFTSVLGLSVAHTEHAEGFTERMLPVGDCHLQALEATGDGVVSRSITRRGPGLHHIAFAVKDLDRAMEALREQGIPLIDERPRAGGMDTMIAFVHPRAFAGVLVELVHNPQP